MEKKSVPSMTSTGSCMKSIIERNSGKENYQYFEQRHRFYREGFSNWIKKIHPFMGEYYCSIYPTFLMGMNDQIHRLRKPAILARDGLIPLIDYFYIEYANFPRIKKRLYVHYDFANFVPNVWEEFVRYYSYYQKESAGADYENLILIGSTNDFLNDKLFFEKRLEMIKPLKDSKCKVYLYLEDLDYSFYHYLNLSKTEVSYYILDKVSKTFGDKLEIINSLPDLIQNIDIQNSSYLYLFEKNTLFSGCYLEWNLLKRKSRPFIPLQSFAGNEVLARVPLSTNHGILLLKKMQEKCDYYKLIDRLDQLDKNYVWGSTLKMNLLKDICTSKLDVESIVSWGRS